MSSEAVAAPRVSTLELFFDLVFVFTITQVARLVSAALILTIAWWMYGGYAIGSRVASAGEIGALLGLLVGMLALESRDDRRLH